MSAPVTRHGRVCRYPTILGKLEVKEPPEFVVARKSAVLLTQPPIVTHSPVPPKEPPAVIENEMDFVSKLVSDQQLTVGQPATTHFTLPPGTSIIPSSQVQEKTLL